MKSSESGRSMTEMLGVLAIVAVLTVGGLAGYSYAMSRYYANSIVDGANKRAVVALEQDAKGNAEEDTWLSEFPAKIIDRFDASLEFTTDEPLGLDEAITIRVSNIPKRVCQRLQDQEYRPDVTALINDLLPEVAVCKDDNTNVFLYAIQKAEYISCSSETDCPACMECDPVKKVCTNVHCQGGYICDPDLGEHGQCRTHCSSYIDCSSGQVCNSEHKCETCLSPYVPNEDKTACGCPQICKGEGYTGQDPDDCSCKCKRKNVDEEGNPLPCACPTETLSMKNDKGEWVCQLGSYCKQHASDSSRFTCYISGSTQPCGNYCTESTGAVGTCLGACDLSFCSKYIEEGTKPVYISTGYGYGCVKDGLKCSPLGSEGYWQCFNSKGSCCRTGSGAGKWTENFGKCKYGSCDLNLCKDLGNNYQTFAQYVAGCVVTKNGKTAYCFPHDVKNSDDTKWEWVCTWNSPNSMSPETRQRCGTCYYSNLLATDSTGWGNCANCFASERQANCPTVGTILADKGKTTEVKATVTGTSVEYKGQLYCSYEYKGKTVWCSTNRTCYFVTPKKDKPKEYTLDSCCYSAYVTPDGCNMGRCSRDPSELVATRKATKEGKISGPCPAEAEFTKKPGGNYYGCKNMIDGDKYLWYWDGSSSHDYACFLNGSDKCGLNCTADCKKCGQVFLPECSGTSATGCSDENLDACRWCVGTEPVRVDGKRVCQCTKNLKESNGHCCSPANEWLNGACQTGVCEEGTCLNISDCIEEVPDIVGRVENRGSLCRCIQPNHCWNTTQKTCVYAPLEGKNYVNEQTYYTVDAEGRCQYACLSDKYEYDTVSGVCKKKKT